MRPLFLDYPEDEECCLVDDQYLFGPDILAAPIVEPGQTRRTVYLPEGKWVIAGDGTVLEGGRRVTLETPLDGIPALARAGSEAAEFPPIAFLNRCASIGLLQRHRRALPAMHGTE